MKKHKLLFVDDEVNILRSLKRLFIDEEHEIYTAANGLDALKLMDKHEFSLILSDYRMPELNGVEFLKLAKEKSPETIRIILTGFADVDVAISAINEGEVYKFIEKPWEGEQLKMQIKRSIEHYELIAERNELLETVKWQNEELRSWNKNLENRVEKKSKELKSAYEELQLKVKELEGRDKILQSLLTIHSFDETFDLILEVILDITLFDKIVMYVSDKEKGVMYPKAGYETENSKKSKIGKEINKFPSLPIPKLKPDEESILTDTSPLNKISEYSYVIPIEKDNICTGAIIVDNSPTRKSVGYEELNILVGFSSLAALAINDYFITTTLPNWQDQINDLLEELK